MRGKTLLAVAASVMVAIGVMPATADAVQDVTAALLGGGGGDGGYVVVFKQDVPSHTVDTVARRAGVAVQYRYSASITGFAARLTSDQLDMVRHHPAVSYVARDGVVRTDPSPYTTSPSPSPTGPPQSPTPSWGLDRIDQHYLPLNNRYWWLSSGRGVRTYVIDTGIRASHPDISGRVIGGYDIVDNDANPDDCNGHGTAVAGVLGGRTYGVAKDALMVPVRVMNCTGSGTYSQVIAGIDWVTAHAVKPAAAVMALGSYGYTPLDQAVERSLAAGITYSVATAANGTDACSFSPGRVPGALTVAPSDINDFRASFSDYGTCLDLFAPGVNITTINYTGGTRLFSGSTMSVSHVAGVVALYLQLYPTATPQQVHDAINRNATVGVIQNPGTGSPNRLLYSLLT